jgi:hypothetical protein
VSIISNAHSSFFEMSPLDVIEREMMNSLKSIAPSYSTQIIVKALGKIRSWSENLWHPRTAAIPTSGTRNKASTLTTQQHQQQYELTIVQQPR